MSEQDQKQEERFKAWRAALGAQLAIERARLKMSQTEMAAQLGVHQRTVSDLERGLNSNINNYISYCEAVELSPVALWARAALALSSLSDPDAGALELLAKAG